MALVAFADVLVFHALHPRQSRCFSALVLCIWVVTTAVLVSSGSTLLATLCGVNALLSLVAVVQVIVSLSHSLSLVCTFFMQRSDMFFVCFCFAQPFLASGVSLVLERS